MKTEDKLKIGKKSLIKFSIVAIFIIALIFLIFHFMSTVMSSVSVEDVQVVEHTPSIFGKIWLKKIIVYNKGSEHYYNFSVETEIPENLRNIELYNYLTSDMKIKITDDPSYNFQVLDTDNNGKNDTVSWIVPELSEVSFAVEGTLLQVTTTAESTESVEGELIESKTTQTTTTIKESEFETNFIQPQIESQKKDREHTLKFIPIYDYDYTKKSKLIFDNDFKLTYEGEMLAIKPFMLVNGVERSIDHSKLLYMNFSHNIKDESYRHKWELNFFNVPDSLEGLGFDLIGDVKKYDDYGFVWKGEVWVDFSDLVERGFTVSIVNNSRVTIGNVQNKILFSTLSLDPTDQLLPNSTNKAYSVSSTSTDSPNLATTEFTSTQYTNIGSSNNVYVSSTATDTITYAGCQLSVDKYTCDTTGTECTAGSRCTAQLACVLSTCTIGNCILPSNTAQLSQSCTMSPYNGASCGCIYGGCAGVKNATSSCAGGESSYCSISGTCTYTCTSGKYNCDGNNANGCEASSPTSTCYNFTFQRFTFNLSSYDFSTITDLKFCWEGYYSSTGGTSSGNLLWNNTASGWQTAQSISTSESTYCIYFDSANKSQVYDSNSKFVQFAVRGNQSKTGHTLTLYSDFAYLSVTYTLSDGSSCTLDSECTSGRCDYNDGCGGADDNKCFSCSNQKDSNDNNCEYDNSCGASCQCDEYASNGYWCDANNKISSCCAGTYGCTYGTTGCTNYGKCEYDDSYNACDAVADCDGLASGTDLNKCVGISYWEDECSSTCGYQDITSVCECTDSSCSCGLASCDGQAPGTWLSSCTAYGVNYKQDGCTATCGGQDSSTCESSYEGCTAISYCDEQNPGYDISRCDQAGQTYFADECSSTCQAQEIGDNICRSSSYGGGCTADEECNGIQAGTGYCDANCNYVVPSEPSVTLSSPVNTTYTSTPLVNVTCSGVNSSYYVNRSVDGGASVVMGIAINNTPYENSTTLSDLSDGSYYIKVSCYNGSYINTSDPVYFTLDTTSPKWSNNKTYPASPNVYANGTIQLNVTWTDEIAFSNCTIEQNFTTQTSTLVNATMTRQGNECYYNINWNPKVGNYTWRSFGNDTSNNQNVTDTWYYTINKNTSTTVSIGPLTAVTYPTSTQTGCQKVIGDPDGTITLYRNNSQVATGTTTTINETAITLGAGTYNYTCVYTASENYTASSSANNYRTVNPTTPTLSVGPTTSVTYYTQTQTGCQRVTGDSSSTLTLYRNNSNVASGTSSPQNETAIILGVGTYNYTCTISATQNYTASSSANNYRTVDINSSASISFLINGSSVNRNEYNNVSLNLSATFTGIETQTITFYRNGTSLGTDSTVPLELMSNLSGLAGNYTYNATFLGNQNYSSASSNVIWVNVTTAPDTTPPKYSLNSTNSTTAGTAVEHSLNWTDNVGLSGYIFQFCNGTWNGSSCLGGTASANWANTNCKYRRKLTFSQPFGTENLTNFPVLLVLNSSRINYTSTNQTDIRFYDADNSTLLYKETELWNSSGNSFVWVKKPTLKNTTDYVWAYYNCSNSNSDNKTYVWDSNYKMVLHLNQSSGTLYDSTSNGNNGTASGSPTYGVAGKIDSAMNFSATSSQYLDCGNAASLQLSVGTEEAWIKTSSPGSSYRGIVAKQLAYGMFLQDSIFGVYDWGAATWRSTTLNLADGNWHHVAFSFNSSASSGSNIYSDGILRNSTIITVSGQTVTLQVAYANSASQYITGTIDEVRISNTTRSASWVNASYLTESDNFITYGSEEQYQAGSGWVNDTWNNTGWDSTEEWSNVTKVINSTIGANISWCFYANDTSNNWNTSEEFSFVTTAQDTQAPTYSKNITNTTSLGKPCEFKLEWNDSVALHPNGQYIFSTNNTGTWVNSSAVSFTSTPQNATNVTILNSTVGVLIQWKFYAWDNAGNWNVSETYNLTTTSVAYLEINLTYPPLNLNVNQNTTFNVNATVTCRGGSCGTVQGTVRYNASSVNPDTEISTITGATPFYIDPCNYKMKLTFKNSASSENLTNFPVLIKLNSSRIDYNKTSTTDIRFYDSDQTTLLKKETELWNTSGDSFIWVKVPQVDKTNTDYIWAYYNCSDTDNDDKTQVWDVNYSLIYHMNDNTTSSVNDSTSNNYHGTKKAANQPIETNGKIGKAQDFELSNTEYISGPTGLNPTHITLEAWIKPESVESSWDMLINKGYPGTPNEVPWDLALSESTASKAGMGVWDGSWHVAESTTTISAGNWYYVIGVYNNTHLVLYVNGKEEGSLAWTTDLKSNSYPTGIGAGDWQGTWNYPYDGIIDEVRISNISRSASWINASYLTESDQFITYGSEETTKISTISCGSMNENDFCQLNWTVNATGDVNSGWKIGVLFNSTQSISDNHTNNATITIIAPEPSITLWSPAIIDFASQNPSTYWNNATNNTNNFYNITIDSTSCSPIDIWIKGTDLENITLSTKIGVSNVTWNNYDNYTTSINMSTTYALINASLSPNTNVTTYYWLNVPAVYAGGYNGTATICGNCTPGGCT